MASSPLNIALIIGTTRPNRFSERPAKWIGDLASKKSGVELEVLDLRDYPMPFFNEPNSPSMSQPEKYTDESAKAWAAKIKQKDGFIVVTGEYNHGIPAVLKNALDYVYHEWNNKAVGFVSYGGVGGARCIEHLRGVAVELQMVPIRADIHIFFPMYMEALKDPKAFDSLNETADKFLDQLIWWTATLKEARKTKK